jgi:SAM-dependent methyltransferase
VTAVDFSPAAIAKAKVKAGKAGADVNFVIDDLTQLARVEGQFDLIVDYGTFDDLSTKDRGAYVDQITSLAKPGARFLLWCFEWELKDWERSAIAILPFGNIALRPGEVERGLRASLRSGALLARVISQSGHGAGPPTSSLHFQRYPLGTTHVATARQAQLT